MSDELRGEQDFSGMTVNERLCECGLLAKFDRAARQRNRAGMIAILQRVQLSTEAAEWTTDTVLSNPKKYGF